MLRNILMKPLIRWEVTENCKFTFMERRYEGFEWTIPGKMSWNWPKNYNIFLQNIEILVFFCERVCYNLRVEAHRPQLSFIHFVDGVRLNGRLPAIPRERNGGVCIALAGNLFLGEVIHINLQNVFWVVSIAWIIYQAVDKFYNRKKWAVCCNQMAHWVSGVTPIFRCKYQLVATVWASTPLLYHKLNLRFNTFC